MSKLMDEMLAIAALIGPPPKRKVLVCHPDHLDLFRSISLRVHDGGQPTWYPPPSIEVRPNPHIAKFIKVWVFPKEWGWRYEQSDRDWCEPLGIGHEEESTCPAFWIVEEDQDWNWMTFSL